MKNLRVVIVHGYAGDTTGNWFPWLQAELTKRGIPTDIPAMPHPESPKLESWLAELSKVVGEPDNGLVLVGHSLGATAILRYLATLPEGVQIAGAVLVAGFAEPIHFTELNGFTEPEWDDAHITSAAKRIMAISSDNDPHLTMEMAEAIRNRFSAELQVLHDAGHISTDAGYTQLPEALWAVLGILGFSEAANRLIQQ